jgi:alpha-galactosidase
MSFGIPTFREIFTCPELRGAALCLVDINQENLERMYGLALRMNEASGLALRIEKTLNRRDALPGADFVINSLAIERCELWKQDFQIPKKHGIRHCLGENGGPGALFFTLRTFPVIMDIIHDMEELCPRAWFLNFSNPETRIVLGVNMYSKIRCIGLCHGIFMGQHDIAAMMGREYGSIEVRGAGMNHFQWILSIRDSKTGEDLYPQFREAEKRYDPSFMPYSRRMFHFFGLYPTCSDDHLGEYQAYGYEAGEHGYDFDQDARDRVSMAKEIAGITQNGPPAGWVAPSGERAVQLITSIFFNRQVLLPSAIVRNGGCIPNIPADVAVEVPVMADASGLWPLHIGPLPPGAANALNNQAAAQRLSVLAAVHASKELALQALLCDPAVNSYTAAVGLLEELWEINKPYIRKVACA